jgi:regulator of ribonuclease activity B
MTYPNDANGDALRHMDADGDDLTRSRDIEFTVVFPNEKSANEFATQMRAQGHQAATEFSETVEGCPWDVVVVKRMVPSYSEIVSFEGMLEAAADPFGGHNDGWGCLSWPKMQ